MASIAGMYKIVAISRARGGMLLSLVTVLALCGVAAPVAADAPHASADPFLWLESVDSPRALNWVKAENAKTLSVLQSDSALRRGICGRGRGRRVERPNSGARLRARKRL